MYIIVYFWVYQLLFPLPKMFGWTVTKKNPSIAKHIYILLQITIGFDTPDDLYQVYIMDDILFVSRNKRVVYPWTHV